VQDPGVGLQSGADQAPQHVAVGHPRPKIETVPLERISRVVSIEINGLYAAKRAAGGAAEERERLVRKLADVAAGRPLFVLGGRPRAAGGTALVQRSPSHRRNARQPLTSPKPNEALTTQSSRRSIA